MKKSNHVKKLMPRSLACLLVALFVLLTVVPVVASADDVITTGQAFVRMGPNKDARDITSVASGKRYTLLGSEKDSRGVTWYKVAFPGYDNAWISSNVSKITNAAKVPDLEEETENSGNPVFVDEVDADVKASGNVFMRKGPGLGFMSVGTLKKDQKLIFLEETSVDSRGVVWNRCWNSVHGIVWVSSKYSDVIGFDCDFGDLDATFTDAVKKDSSILNEFPLRVIATGTVYLRKGPGLKFMSVASISKGAKLHFLGGTSVDDRGVVWFEAWYPGYGIVWTSEKFSKTDGFYDNDDDDDDEVIIPDDEIPDVDDPEPIFPDFVQATGRVNLRASASLSGKIITSIAKGAKLTFLGDALKDSRGVWWYAAAYKGDLVWVSSAYSKLV